MLLPARGARERNEVVVCQHDRAGGGVNAEANDLLRIHAASVDNGAHDLFEGDEVIVGILQCGVGGELFPRGGERFGHHAVFVEVGRGFDFRAIGKPHQD